MAQTFEAHLEARQSRRMAAQDRYLTRLEVKEERAERMIGELCRDGAEVFYIYPVGGKYREGTRGDLIRFLIRNGYA